MTGRKRVLVIASLFLCLAGLLAGCNDVIPGPSASPAETAGLPDHDPAAAGDVITVTYKDLSAGRANVGFSAEEFDTTPIGEYIRKRFGLRFVQLGTSANENREELARDIASNQMADVMRWSCNPFDSTLYEIYAESALEGQLADLTDAIRAHAPSVEKAIAPDRLPVYAKAVTYPKELGNRIYQLPVRYEIGDPQVSGWGFYIRGDLAAKLDVKTPSGWFDKPEDLYNLLVRIQGTSLRDANGYKIWPGGGVSVWSLLSYTDGHDFGGAEEIGVIDGKVTGFFQTEWPWQQIRFMRKLIDERLLDPEVFTQSQQEYVEKLRSGSYGIVPFYAPDQAQGWDVLEAINAPGGRADWKYQPLGRIANYRGDRFYTANRGISSVDTLLFSKTAPIDELMQYAQWTLSEEGRRILTFGPDGLERSIRVAEGYKWTDEYYQKIRSGEWQKTLEYRVNSAAAMFFGLYGADAPETNALFGGPQARGASIFLNEPRAAESESEQKADALRMFEGGYQLLDKNTLRMAGQGFSGMGKLNPLLMQHNMFDYDDVLKRCYLARTEEDARKIYDDYVQSLADNGYDEWIAYMQAQYDRDPDGFTDYMSPQ